MSKDNRLRLELGPMNIWCELKEDPLKTLLCRVHTRKPEVGPKWPQM